MKQAERRFAYGKRRHTQAGRHCHRLDQLGKGAEMLATGSLAALAGKPYTWMAKPTGPGQFTIEVKQ